jgi:hypothetical protein
MVVVNPNRPIDYLLILKVFLSRLEVKHGVILVHARLPVRRSGVGFGLSCRLIKPAGDPGF